MSGVEGDSLAFLWGIQRGYSLRKENIPPYTPKRKDEGRAPSTPDIDSL